MYPAHIQKIEVKMGKSSKDKRDTYYRLAKEQGWRARSAFKLLQIDEEFNIFENVSRVVDLCAAPGSWSQVLSRVLIQGEPFGRELWNREVDRLGLVAGYAMHKPENKVTDSSTSIDSPHVQAVPAVPTGPYAPAVPDPSPSSSPPRREVRIVAIDLQPMSPLEGITMLKADITDPATVPLLLEALDPEAPADTSVETSSRPVDLVLSDGAPDVTGLHDLDMYLQGQLLWAALSLAMRVLKPGGTFVGKVFRGKDIDLLYAQLRTLFRRVTVAKPRSSRASSLEAFVVCQDFTPLEGVGLGQGQARLGRNPGQVRVIGEQDGEQDGEPGAMSQSRKLLADGTTELTLEPGDRARWIAPFLSCGDLSPWDADTSYELPDDYRTLDPVQLPIAPPYQPAIEARRLAGGAHGKTKKLGI